MEKIAIIGLGLIGTSIGLGLREWAAREKQAVQVIGFDIDLAQQQQAKRMKATDDMSWDMPSVVRDADLVVVATPVGTVADVFETIAEHLKHGSVVTDVCSTKGQVLTWAREKLPTTCNFIGGHPMAGKTQSTEGAEATLFKGATWCICPAVRASEASVQTVLGLVAALGAEAQFIDADEHDGFVGAVSHLPFVMSSALMNTVSASPAWRDMKLLSASGFRDVSRLAAGGVEMHRDICLTNRESLLRWLDTYTAELQGFRAMLADQGPEQREKLAAYFTRARDARADWATAERTDGELAQDTETELSKNGLGGAFGQMLFGGMLRRRLDPNKLGGDGEAKRPERKDRK